VSKHELYWFFHPPSVEISTAVLRIHFHFYIAVLAHTHTHTHARTHAHTRTHTHTHTHDGSEVEVEWFSASLSHGTKRTECCIRYISFEGSEH